MSEPAREVSAARIAVMNTLPGADVPGETPLQHPHLPAPGNDEEVALALEEMGLLGHLVLRCCPDNSAQVAAFERAVGLSLPVSPLRAASAGDRVVRWISPDEWLITTPSAQAFAIETQIHGTMPGHYSLVDVSGGFTVYRVSGPRVPELLKRCVSVDLHIAKFPVDKVVSTVFAKHQAIVHRGAEDAFELVVRRSYAEYLWRWLHNVAQQVVLVANEEPSRR